MGNLVSEMGFMFLVSFFPAGQPGNLEFVTEIADEPVERGEEQCDVRYRAAPAHPWRKHSCARSPAKAELSW